STAKDRDRKGAEIHPAAAGAGSLYPIKALGTSWHFHPLPLPGRLKPRIDGFLDFPSLAEVRPFGLSPRDRRQEVGDLDRLQVVEPKLVPGCHAEKAVGVMLRPGLDARKAGMARIGIIPIEEQLVEPLLGEDKRALAP